MKNKLISLCCVLLVCLQIQADSMISEMHDNLIKVVQKYMSVTPITDYIVHYNEEVTFCLDQYFQGQNPTYQMQIAPPEHANSIIQIQPFMELIAQQQFGYGKAVTGYVGYCVQINRHILYIYTERGYLLAYLIQIGLVVHQSNNIIRPVAANPLRVNCPNFQNMQVECSTFYSQVNNYLLLGCKNAASEPVLVRIGIDVPQRDIYVSSCILFEVNDDTQNIYIKYVSPNNDFVIIEVEQVDGTISNVRDYYIAIDKYLDEKLKHSELLGSVRLSQLSSEFLGSSYAEPLNIRGFAKINSLLLAFNEMGQLYEIRLRQAQGFLQALSPISDSTRRILKYKIKSVMQASIWDEIPNLVLIEGTSTDDGTQSVLELTISATDISSAVGNAIYLNLNPLDTFYLNQRGTSMENQNFLIQEIYEDGKKLLLRIFQKNLSFYSMPISDYFITYRGYVSALILDFYSNLIIIVEDSVFKLLNINGNTLKLGGSDLASIYEDSKANSTIESTTQLATISQNSYQVFMTEQPGFLSEDIDAFNQTFRVKFVDPSSTEIFQVDHSLVSTFEIGRPSVVRLKELFFIGPNVTLELQPGLNPNLPDSYLQNVNASLLPIIIQSDHSILSPFVAQFRTKCKNYTLFVAEANFREYVCHLCFSEFKIYLFLAKYDTTLHDFDISLQFSMHPFQILDLNYDAGQKIILALTKISSRFETAYYIHVLNIVVTDHGNSIEWMGKSYHLPHPPRPPTHSKPSTFYKPEDTILLVVTQNQKWILVYEINIAQNPSIVFLSQQMNPQHYDPSRNYGSIWTIHFLPFKFLLFAYTNSLVVARADPNQQVNDTFTFTQKFKDNIYSKIEEKDGYVYLYKQAVIEQYDFTDPFIPSLNRFFSIPYPNYEFYTDSIGEIITTDELPHSIIGIWKNTLEKDNYFIACFKTNTKMSHDALYFIRQLNLQDSLKASLKNLNPVIIFGYQLFGGNNFIFLNIGNVVLPYQIFFDQAIKLETPSVQISSKIPLNFTITTPSSCTRMKYDSDCAYSLSLFGEMSGVIIQPNQNTKPKNQIILSSPTQNPRVIMDPYFAGFNLRFNVDKILSDPDQLNTPLLKSPEFLHRLQLPTFESSTNITHQFFIRKPYMDFTVLATVDSLRSVTFQQLVYSQEENKVLFTHLLSLTIPDLDQIIQIREINRPSTSSKPPAAFWVVYGVQNGFRRIVLYNVTALYHDNSQFIDFNAEAIDNFHLTQSIYPWYIPNKWSFSKSHQYFVITYSYSNPYDEPIILFKTDFESGKIIQIGIINAIMLKLNIFSSASFYIHSLYPIMIAGGGGPYLTIVNLQTQSYFYSISLEQLDPIFASLDSIRVQWLKQIDNNHFYAFVDYVGLVQLHLSIFAPQDDFDNMSDPQITLVGITYEPGTIVYKDQLETPFTIQKNLIGCLFQHTPNSGNTTYRMKLMNSYEPTRSRIFYQFQLPQSIRCYRPQFFNPFSIASAKHNSGKIFLSFLCDGQVIQYQLWEFSFLELDLSFINNIDPTHFPLTQELQIRASNRNDVYGVTLDFQVSVLNSGQALTDADIGGLAVIILVLIVVFILLGWVIRRQKKSSKPTMNELKATFVQTLESSIVLETENMVQDSSGEVTTKYELSEEAERKEIVSRFGSDEF